MKCQKCGQNEANTHFVQNINGKATELWLCSDCAEELGIGGMFSGFGGFGIPGGFGSLFGGQSSLSSPFASAFEQLLGGMFGLPSSAAAKSGRSSAAAADRCPLCGSTFADIAKRGKAGCPECYTHFAEQLAPSIGKLHGTRTHTGGSVGAQRLERRPNAVRPAAPQRNEAAGAEQKKASELLTLKKQLKAAVEAEEYEKAAALRDRIKELEA